MTKLKKDLFPKKKEIFSYIEDLCQWGYRRTGTEAGRKSAEYIADKFRLWGLEDIKTELVPSLCMTMEACELMIDGQEIECFQVNGTNHRKECGRFCFGDDGAEEEFVFVGEGTEADFQGLQIKDKIVVSSIRFLPQGPTDILKWNASWECYDPDGQMKGKKKTDIYSPNNWPKNYFLAIKNGAKGFVGILEDYMDDPYWYNEDYTEIGNSYGISAMALPAVWISRSSGKVLKEKACQGKTLTGKMKVITDYQYKEARNVSGILPGQSDEIILVHSHHDSSFYGAVQDASGISEVLALAQYFSKLEPEERKKSFMFAATDTHYTDYRAHQEFIKARQTAGDKIILDIAIEHICKEAVFDEKMNLYETGEVESRLFYIGEETGLYEFVKDRIKKYGLKKSILGTARVGAGLESDEPYEFQQDEVISDAYYFNKSGIPVVSMVCGPMYLFHPSDKPDRIPQDQLEPVGMLFTEIALEAAERL